MNNSISCGLASWREKYEAVNYFAEFMGQIEMAGFWNLAGIFVIIKIVQSKASQDWLCCPDFTKRLLFSIKCEVLGNNNQIKEVGV